VTGLGQIILVLAGTEQVVDSLFTVKSCDIPQSAKFVLVDVKFILNVNTPAVPNVSPAFRALPSGLV
jgi:hypothetical protein